MPGPVFREGETVELRTVEEDDLEFLHETINDPRVRTTLAAFEPVTRSREREWIESIGEDGDVRLLIAVDGEAVGTVGLDVEDDVPWGTAEVGYLIEPEAWGNGYATDAVREICGHAFEERRLHKVHAAVYETNPASRRVLEKAGFSEEGVLREEAYVSGEYVDCHRYGLLADEYLE